MRSRRAVLSAIAQEAAGFGGRCGNPAAYVAAATSPAVQSLSLYAAGLADYAAGVDLPPFSVPPVWNISAWLMNSTRVCFGAGLHRQLAADAGTRSVLARCDRTPGAA